MIIRSGLFYNPCISPDLPCIISSNVYISMNYRSRWLTVVSLQKLVRGERGIREDLDENSDTFDRWMLMSRLSFVFECVLWVHQYLSLPGLEFLAKIVVPRQTKT
jgi:hypothetical protein